MKKICFISLKSYQLFNPKIESVFGWAEVQMALLAKELAKHKNLDISMIVADYGQDKKEIRNNVSLRRKVSSKDPIWKRAFSLPKIFLKINADVYIKRGITLSCGIMTLLCKIMKKKFVYMVAHDDEVDGKKDIYKHRYAKYIIQYVFHNATIIVQNEYQQTMLNKQGIQTKLIKSGYPITNTTTQQEKDTILRVSRSKKRKRPEVFIQLAGHFPQEHFTMICPSASGEKKYHTHIKQLANKQKNIQFIDFVPFEQIDTYFAKAKVFVNTSISEGFPNTYIQSLKNQTPILSLCVDPSHILQKNQIGIVCENQPKLLQKNLQILLTDKNSYKQMQHNSTNYIKENHNISTTAQQLLETCL